MSKDWAFLSQQNFHRSLLAPMVLLLTLGTAFQANAVQANPNLIAETQPDGTPITLLLKGDEWFHWYEDLDGYTIVEDGGTYFYATLDNAGNLAPTAVPVGSIDPATAGIAQNVLPTKEQIINQVAAARQSLSPPVGVPPPVLATGTVKNIIILARFSNHHSGRGGVHFQQIRTLIHCSTLSVGIPRTHQQEVYGTSIWKVHTVRLRWIQPYLAG